MNETGTTLALLLKTIVADGGGRGDIHPYKELTEGVTLTSEDVAVLWDSVRDTHRPDFPKCGRPGCRAPRTLYSPVMIPTGRVVLEMKRAGNA